MRIYFYALMATCLLTATSCGTRESRESRPTDSITADTEKAIVSDTVAEEELPDTMPKESVRRFPTTDSQLNYMRQSNHWDKYSTGILPQMAQEVPSYCEKLLQNTFDHFIVVDKGKMTLFLYDKYGNIEKSYGIACAKNFGTKQRRGDSRTTEGYFTAEGVYDSTNWLFTDDNGYTSPTRGVYGPRFIRVQHPIGIHGTGSPGSIGKRTSHGCIRVKNENILELVKYVQAGTPIIISPGPRDMAVNQHYGISMPSVTTEPGGQRATPGSYDASLERVSTPSKKVTNETTVQENEKSEGMESGSVEPKEENKQVNTPVETSEGGNE